MIRIIDGQRFDVLWDGGELSTMRERLGNDMLQCMAAGIELDWSSPNGRREAYIATEGRGRKRRMARRKDCRSIAA